MSFFEIFNPGERFMREEKDSQKMLVAKPTPGGGAPLGIDLDGGKATITIRIASRVEDSEPPAVENPPEQSASAEQADHELERDATGSSDSSEATNAPDTGEAPEAPGTSS